MEILEYCKKSKCEKRKSSLCKAMHEFFEAVLILLFFNNTTCFSNFDSLVDGFGTFRTLRAGANGPGLARAASELYSMTTSGALQWQMN